MGTSVVLLAVGSAAAYAVAANLKHASAGQVPDAQGLSGRSIARFVRATVTHRLWLLSIVVDLVGAVLQVLALRRGALAVVQPLLVSGLVIALVLRARSSRGVRRVEVAWGAVLAVTLGVFLAVAGVRQTAVAAADRPSALTVAFGGGLLVGCCVVAARRRRGRSGSAALLGVAVGIVNASTAAMLKSLTAIAGRGVSAVVGSWQVYVLVVLVATALLLNQLAFQAGPLSASLPMISSVDPLASVVVGVLVFDETMRSGLVSSCALVGLLGVLAAAVVVLSRGSARATAAQASDGGPDPDPDSATGSRRVRSTV